MKKILRLAAMTVMAFSLTTGVAAASTGSINTTGQDSYNKVEVENRRVARVRNNNKVGVGNVNLQLASSGDAKVKKNTTAGGAKSGDVVNESATSTTVRLNNSGSSAAALGSSSMGGSNSGSIKMTGQGSYNKVEFENKSYTSVKNNNTVGVVNLSVQAAASGDASVVKNTTGGSATSGDVTNVNTTSTTVEITN